MTNTLDVKSQGITAVYRIKDNNSQILIEREVQAIVQKVPYVETVTINSGYELSVNLVQNRRERADRGTPPPRIKSSGFRHSNFLWNFRSGLNKQEVVK